MLWVGLMGGASYVNVMFMILSSGKVGFEYKELVLNVSLMHNNLGIIMAALLAMAVDNFWLKWSAIIYAIKEQKFIYGKLFQSQNLR